MNVLNFLRRHRWLHALFALGMLAGHALRRVLPFGRRAPLRSQAIIHGASEGIISTNASYTILSANSAAAAMFGTSVEAMQGRPLSRYITPPPDSGDAALRYFGDNGASGRIGRRATDYAVTGIKADGSLFPLEGSISTVQDDGQVINTVIVRDVTERQQVQQSLTRSHEQLRQLSAMLQSIREEERTHIARELHDDLGQLLASLRMDLALLQQQGAAPPASERLMQGMDERLLAAITSLRRIAANLRPRALDEGGLYFALQGLRREFVERHGIACELFADEHDLRLDDATSTAIFRIAQEALTNIARHANASNVSLNLYRTEHKLLVTIRDDGRGIAPADMEKTHSLGLVGMRERVAAMLGEITICGDEAPGTRIDIVLPLACDEPAPATSGLHLLRTRGGRVNRA